MKHEFIPVLFTYKLIIVLAHWSAERGQEKLNMELGTGGTCLKSQQSGDRGSWMDLCEFTEIQPGL